MLKRTEIKDFGGKPIGYIVQESNGDQKATDFFGKPLGFYRAKADQTTDFFGVVIARGNILSSLIYDNQNKPK